MMINKNTIENLPHSCLSVNVENHPNNIMLDMATQQNLSDGSSAGTSRNKTVNENHLRSISGPGGQSIKIVVSKAPIGTPQHLLRKDQLSQKGKDAVNKTVNEILPRLSLPNGVPPNKIVVGKALNGTTVHPLSYGPFGSIKVNKVVSEKLPCSTGPLGSHPAKIVVSKTPIRTLQKNTTAGTKAKSENVHSRIGSLGGHPTKIMVKKVSNGTLIDSFIRNGDPAISSSNVPSKILRKLNIVTL